MSYYTYALRNGFVVVTYFVFKVFGFFLLALYLIWLPLQEQWKTWFVLETFYCIPFYIIHHDFPSNDIVVRYLHGVILDELAMKQKFIAPDKC